MTKIIISKTEDVKSVIKKIEGNEEAQITLVIPRESAFGEQVSNFETLREAVTELDKEIIIESVDENVLALSEANGFSSLHPLFRGGRSHVSDILPAKSARASRAKKEKSEEKVSGAAAHKKNSREPVMLHKIETPESAPVAVEVKSDPEEYARPEEEYAERKTRKINRKGLLVVLGAIALFAVVYLGGEKLFARAEITIQLKSKPWQDVSTLTASTALKNVSASGIPVQVFNPPQPTTDQSFPASGKSTVSEKAQGKLTVFNAYSSQPQTLVATTRFESPDGKIIRLVSQIIVPGAKIEDGKIIPSSIVADVVADKPGAEYNIGPLSKLTVPGFKSSPKFEGFYGALEIPLAGGFVGIRRTATAADIASAKDKTTQVLKSISSSGLYLKDIPQGFKILDGATTMSVTKLVVNNIADDKGNFWIHGEIKLTAIGFREEDVKSWLLSRLQNSDESASFKSLNDLKYSNVQPDFTKKTLKLTVTSSGVVAPSFDTDAFRASVAGKSADDARALILKISGLSDGKLSLWPFWLTGIPSDLSKIKVTVK